MDKLKELLMKCECGVFIEVNEHRDYYQTAEQAILEDIERDGEKLDEDIKAKMIELNTIVRVQFYPNTPIGHYVVYHYDIDLALDAALSCLK